MDSTTIAFLVPRVERIFRDAQKTLDIVATGNTLKNTKARYTKTSEGAKIQIFTTEAGWFRQLGRRPNQPPPPSVNLIPWIEARRIKARDNFGRFLSNEKFAYILARSIGIKGIEPVDWVGEAERELEPFLNDVFGSDRILNQIFSVLNDKSKF
jgi:hypothetical protein